MRVRARVWTVSEQVFNEVKPEQDPSMLAAFLNSNLFNAFSGKRARHAEHAASKVQPPPPEHAVLAVELPPGLRRSTLRDAMLQWRLRHTAHPYARSGAPTRGDDHPPPPARMAPTCVLSWSAAFDPP